MAGIAARMRCARLLRKLKIASAWSRAKQRLRIDMNVSCARRSTLALCPALVTPRVSNPNLHLVRNSWHHRANGSTA